LFESRLEFPELENHEPETQNPSIVGRDGRDGTLACERAGPSAPRGGNRRFAG